MTPLRELGEWCGGNTPSKANAAYWDNGSVPWVSPKDMKVDEIASSEDRITEQALADGRVSLVPTGSVLFVTRSGILAHTFPVAVTTLPVTINQDLKALSPNAGVSPKYVAHAVRGASQRILKQCSKHGTTVASVDTKALLDFEIPMVALDEQRSIVAEIEKQFSRLDEAVANLQRVKANLKRYRSTVLASAVGGTIFNAPVKFTIAPDKPLTQSLETPEMAPDLPLPQTWSWARADEVCSAIASGSTPKADDMSSGSGEVPFIKVYNLTFDGTLDFTVKPTYVAAKTHNGMLARSRCIPGDVLMNIVGPPLGKVSIVPDDFSEWNINQAVVTFRVNERILSQLFAYWLMSPPVRKRIERTSKATAGQSNVQVSTCRRLVLPIPPIAEQRRIVDELDRRLSIIRGVETEVDANLKRAKALRQAVLQRAFGMTNNGVARAAEPILSSGGKDMPRRTLPQMPPPRASDADDDRQDLLTVLHRFPKGVAVEQLLLNAGYQGDQVDQFYRDLAKLRDAIEVTVPNQSKKTWPHGQPATVRLRGKSDDAN
jgi:type I restriction enzyme, S subunit